MNPHVALVDDEEDILDTLREYLELQAFQVSVATGGPALREIVRQHRVDAVVLDVRMPGEDGLSLARFLRAHTRTAIIMLTGERDLIDRVVGLELGADDYLAKPVDPRELVARVQAVLRRYHAGATPGSGVCRFGRCRLSLARRKLFDAEGREIPLTARELDLLEIFASRPNRVLTREQLYRLADDREWSPLDRSLDLRISRLRRKIEPDPSRPETIKTVHGLGYVFEGNN